MTQQKQTPDPVEPEQSSDEMKAEISKLRAALKVEAEAAEAELTAAEALDATDEGFTEADAGERGWLVFYEPINGKGERRFHRVPVALWPAYEKSHGF